MEKRTFLQAGGGLGAAVAAYLIALPSWRRGR